MLASSTVTSIKPILFIKSKQICIKTAQSLFLKRSDQICFYSAFNRLSQVQRILETRKENFLLVSNYKMTIESKDKEVPKKKQSKFKMFYQQYGPSFLVIHLTTVVAWIYLFFLISKQ